VLQYMWILHADNYNVKIDGGEINQNDGDIENPDGEPQPMQRWSHPESKGVLAIHDN
jgi:hypothetical protein